VDFSYSFEGFDFSREEVKRAVGIWLIGFVLTVASPALGFSYLETMNA